MSTAQIREALEVLGRTIDHKPDIRQDALTALDIMDAELSRLREACVAGLMVAYWADGHGGHCGDVITQLRNALNREGK